MREQTNRAQKVFSAIMTALMIFSMSPVQGFADVLTGEDVPEPISADSQVVIGEDGEPILMEDDSQADPQAEATPAEPEAEPVPPEATAPEPEAETTATEPGDAAAAAEPEAEAPAESEPAEGASPEAANGFSAMASNDSVDSTTVPNLTITGNKSIWSYDAATQTVTVTGSSPLTMRRTNNWNTDHKTTLVVDSSMGADITLVDVWFDGRTLSDEEAKSLFLRKEDGFDRWRPEIAESVLDADPNLKERATTEGRAGIDITSGTGEVTLTIKASNPDLRSLQYPHIFGGTQRAGIEKNNGSRKLTIYAEGQSAIVAGLGSYREKSGPAAIGSKANANVENIEIIANRDKKNPGDLYACASTESFPTSNDFGAGIGSGSGGYARGIVLTGPDYDYYDENSSAMFLNLKGTASNGSAIGAGYNSKGQSSVTIKGGAVNPMTYGYAALGAAVGISTHDMSGAHGAPNYTQASCDVTLTGGYLNPQSYMGPGIVCGDNGAYVQKDGILHVDGGYMADFYDEYTRDYAYGLYAKTVEIGEGMSDEAIADGRDWAGYVSADTSFGIVAKESMTFYKGMMNVYGSNYTNKVKNAQGIYTKTLTVKGGDLYSNSGILLQENGELEQTGGILTSISGRGTTFYAGNEKLAVDTPQKAAIGVEKDSPTSATKSGTITIKGSSKCEVLGGFDAGDGTITVAGDSYVRAITGSLVGAKNETIALNCFEAKSLNIDGGRVVGYVDNGSGHRPTSVDGGTSRHGVELRTHESGPVIAQNGESEWEVPDERAPQDTSLPTQSLGTLGESDTFPRVFGVSPTFAKTFTHFTRASANASAEVLDEINDDAQAAWGTYKWVEIGSKVVIQPHDPVQLGLSADAATITTSLRAVCEPSDATVSYSSSDPEVLSFENERSPQATLHHAGKVKVTVKPTGNFLGSEITYEVTITKASLSDGEVTITGWTYGEAPHKPTFTSSVLDADDYKITYKYAPKAKAGDESAFVSEVPTDAGDYVVKACVPESADHGAKEVTADFTIQQATGTIEPPRTQLDVVSGEDATFPIKVKGDGDLTADPADPGIAALEFTKQGSTLNGENNGSTIWSLKVQPKSVGTQQITLKLAGCTNFTAAEKSLTLVVSGEAKTIGKPTAKSVTYDGEVKVGYAYPSGGQDHVTVAGDVQATRPGTYQATFTPDNGYVWADSKNAEPFELSWTIDKQNLSACTVSLDPSTMKYNGAQLKPTPTVTFTKNGTSATLVKDTDYTVSYGENNSVGDNKGTVTIQATSDSYFVGSKSATFKIEQGNINDDTIHGITPVETYYNGQEQKPTFSAINRTSNIKLEENKDYKLTYESDNYREVGKHRVIITGMGNYIAVRYSNGSTQIPSTQTILPAKMEDLIIEGVKAKTLSNGVAKQDAIVVKNAKGDTLPSGCYTLSYENNTVAPGTAQLIVTGDNIHITGSKTVDFPVLASSQHVDVIQPPEKRTNLVYNGAEQIGVPAGEKYELTGDWKATVPGSYTAWVTPKSGCAWSQDGDITSRRIDWQIEKIDLDKATLDGIVGEVSYAEPTRDKNGNLHGVEQNVKVMVNGVEIGADLASDDENLKDRKLYTITYEGNTAVGHASLKVEPSKYLSSKFGWGDYNPYVKGSKTASFDIIQGEASIDATVYASVQIKDGRSMKAELPLTYKGDGRVEVTSDDPEIATAEIIDATQSEASIGTSELLAPMELGFNGEKPNKLVSIKPRGRGNTTLHVTSTGGNNFKTTEETIYVTVYETYGGDKLVAIPTGLHLPYTGGSQVGVAYDEGVEFVSREGSTKEATEVGNYSAIVKPAEGYVWADGEKSKDEQTISWSIEESSAQSLAAVDENGSLVTASLDDTLDLVNGETPKTYRFNYKGEGSLKATSSTPGIVDIGNGTLAQDGGYYTLTVTPKSIGSTKITVSAEGSEAESALKVEFWITVIKSEKNENTIPVPNSRTLTYNGKLQTGIPKGEGYTLSGPSVNGAGESVAVNAGTYYVTATPAEGFTWTNYGDSSPRIIEWTIERADLSSATIDYERNFPADGTMHFQNDLVVKLGNVTVNPTEYELSYTGDQKTSGDQEVTITAVEGRNLTGSITKTYTIGGAEPMAQGGATVVRDEASAANTQIQTMDVETQDAAQPMAASSDEAPQISLNGDRKTDDAMLDQQYYLGPYAENTAYSGGTTTTTTQQGTQTGSKKTPSGANLFQAWSQLENQPREKVTVAVIDTGCLMNHPDLVANLDRDNAKDTYHENYPVGAASMVDDVGHGTHVAGIIAGVANNGIGVAGTSYNCQVLPIRTFDDWGYATSDDIYEGFQYIEELIEKGRDDIKVINMSLGGYGWENDPLSNDQLTLKSIEKLRNEHNVLTLAAGGNGDGAGNPITAKCFPSDMPNVLSVTSLNKYGADSVWSDYNEYKDVSAPGEDILSTYLNKDYAELDGTSMATPLVSGIAALLYSTHPGISADDVENAIVDSGHKIENRGVRTVKMNNRFLGRDENDQELYAKPVKAVDAAAALEMLDREYDGAEFFMSDCTLEIASSVQYYRGPDQPIEPTFTVKNKNKDVVDPGQYDVKFENNTDVGTATIVVTGKKGAGFSYRGVLRKTFEIKYNLGTKGAIASIETQQLPVKSGGKVEPLPTVTYEGRTLTAGRDYLLTYANNTTEGTASVTVTGTGHYDGTLTRNFVIGTSGGVQFPVARTDLVYNGQVQVGVPDSPDGNYRITGNTSSEVGTHQATVTLNDGLSWSESGKSKTETIEWEIKPAEPRLAVSPTAVAMEENASKTVDIAYGGTGTLSVSGENAIAEATLEGTQVTITGKVPGDTTVTVSATADGSYTAASTTINVHVAGKQATPASSLPEKAISVEYAGGPLTGVLAGDGYRLSVDPESGAEVDPSTGNVMVERVGTYKVHLAREYDASGTYEAQSANSADDITLEVTPVPAERLTIAPLAGDPYTGAKQTPEPEVVYKKALDPLAATEDYALSYGDNVDAGKEAGTVTLDFDQGSSKNYEGSRTIAFDIPKAPSSLSASETLLIDRSETQNDEQTLEVTYSDPIELKDIEVSNDEVADISLEPPQEVGGTYLLKATPKKVGSANVLITAPGNDNYDAKEITVTVSVVDGTAVAPTPPTNLVYTGNEQVCVQKGKGYRLDLVPESPGEGVRIDEAGDAVATNAGAYRVVARLEEGYGWSDGEAERERTIPFTIAKAPSTITLTPATLSMKTNETTKTVAISGAVGDLTLDAGSNDSVATASLSGTTITVTQKGTGQATFKVTSSGDDNHDGAEALLTVKVDPPTASGGNVTPKPDTGGNAGGGSGSGGSGSGGSGSGGSTGGGGGSTGGGGGSVGGGGGGGGGAAPAPAPGGGEEPQQPETPEQPSQPGAPELEKDVQPVDDLASRGAEELSGADNAMTVEPKVTDADEVTWTVTLESEAREEPAAEVGDEVVGGFIRAMASKPATVRRISTLTGVEPEVVIEIRQGKQVTEAEIRAFAEKLGLTTAQLGGVLPNATGAGATGQDLVGHSYRILVTGVNGKTITYTLAFRSANDAPVPEDPGVQDPAPEEPGADEPQQPDAVAIPVYRLYNPWTYEHLLTTEVGEYDSLQALGWQGEGESFRAPSTSTTPIYRLYNPWNGDHLYTTDQGEYDSLQAGGWSGEGTKMYGAGEDGLPIYRMFNPWMTANGGAFSHLWTSDANEYETNAQAGWNKEGVAWYGIR